MPVMSDMIASVVECHSVYDGGAVVLIMYGNSPRLAAHLAVFDVVLLRAAAGVESDHIGLAAIRTGDHAGRGGGAVAERKVSVEVEIVAGLAVALVVECEAHTSNLQHGAAGRLTIPSCPISLPPAPRWRCRSDSTSCSPKSGSLCR